MDIRLFGPVEVRVGGNEVPLGGAQQRCVFGVLAAHHGTFVPAERLAAALWEDDPPKTARTVIQVKVSQLRKALGDVIQSTSAGYSLVVPAEHLDLGRFRSLVAEGRAAARREDAVDAWTRALDEWRGQPLQGLGTSWVDQRVRGPLLRERWDLVEEYAAALIELGCHSAVPGVLQELRDEEPFRETSHALVMTALWHAGRSTEALELFRDVQRLFAAELGVDPGPRLRDLHQRVLEGRLPVPRQLPMDLAGFVGRDAEVERLLALLRPGGVVAVVTGAAGIGKSALATHVGHLLAEHFPDGQLHVDLNGYGQGDPLPPERLLPRFLVALGVSAPAGFAEQLDLYRSTLATRRVLLVLDNAAHVEQVRPLLPGGSPSAVIVTSRDALRGLVALQGARSVTLRTLTPADARDLLADLIGRRRVEADPEAAAEMAELCGHLPLALRIAGANLVAGHAPDLRRYVAELRADRWNTLAVEGDAQATVAAAFGHSYAALAPGTRLLFRRLGLIPGCDFTARSAARLAGTDPGTAGRLLAGLASAHLVEEHATGRYHPHDLVRLYARDRCTDEDAPAPARLHAYYLHTAREVARLLEPSIELLPLDESDLPPDTEHLADAAAARDWLDAEQHNLLAVIDHVEGRTLWRLVEVLRAFLTGRIHLDVVATLARRALEATERDGDLAGQASMHHTLANVRFVLNDPRAAITHYERASALYEELGWASGTLLTLTNLASANCSLGDFRTGSAHYAHVIRVWEELGPSVKLAATLENHALVLLWQGHAREALEQQRRAIRMRSELAEPNDSSTWRMRSQCILGDIHMALGDLTAAEEVLHDGLEWTGEFQTAAALSSAAVLQHLRGDAGVAAMLARCAVQAGRGKGLSGEYDEARTTLARVDESLPLEERLAMLQEVLDSYGERTHPYLNTRVRLAMAGVLLRHGRHEEAAQPARQALDTATGHGLRRLIGQALTLIARVHLAEGRLPSAREYAGRAAALHRELGHRLDEADAMAVQRALD
ncbi:BTAD domain-containing putative transcriptional regulator [Nonomuraea sp. NPDC000554]|uniref:AfsR/SARP family transcriptional regulator n=1 Tax=Nonomuraea sp. NPDC000554 TaxID=3154259 RepID=UPI003329EDB9